MGLAMAKESILFNDENRDAQLAIVVILALILLFIYPLALCVGRCNLFRFMYMK